MRWGKHNVKQWQRRGRGRCNKKMPRLRLIPDKTELRRLVRENRTHAEIAELVYERTGQKVTRGAVSAAISRAGLSTPASRHKAYLPWRVKIEHSQHYAARMLRLLARRDSGEQLNTQDEKRLDAWVEKLAAKAVVAYAPDTDEGFFYIRQPKGYRRLEAPILRQEVRSP